MLDQFSCFTSLVRKIVIEDGKVSMDKPTIRLRPVIRCLFKKDVIPYVLSISEKLAFSSTGDSISLISVLPSLWSHLRKLLKEMNKDVIDFNDIHSMSLDCLQIALELCLDSNVTSKLTVVYQSWTSMGLSIDSYSIVNRRRRQEDRWFATSDLPAYGGAWSAHHRKLGAHAFPLSALGVFDGHNGPEAAEHCSHLTPYLLSVGLQRQLNSGTICITDLLVDVFHELNQSVNKGRASGIIKPSASSELDSVRLQSAGEKQLHLQLAIAISKEEHDREQRRRRAEEAKEDAKVQMVLEQSRREDQFWSSGTTATVCVFYGGSIYTAWVGDSQAWLVYAKGGGGNPSKGSAVPFVSTSDRVTSVHTPVPSPVCCEVSSTANGSEDETTEQTPFTEAATALTTNGFAVALTDTLHRPEFAPEFVSVIRCGGMVTTEVCHGDDSTSESRSFAGVDSWDTVQASCFHTAATNWLSIPPLSDPGLVECRVGGVSCVSRAIGDDQTINGISALPSVTVCHCHQDDSHKPLCLILASDGLWDAGCCSGPAVSERAHQWFNNHSDSTGEVEKGFAKELAQVATNNGASDNVTCVVLWLNRWNSNNISEPKFDSFVSRKMLWPCGSRVTSSLDIRKHRNRIGDLHHSSSVENVGNSEIRYSSPPRYKSPSSLFFGP